MGHRTLASRVGYASQSTCKILLVSLSTGDMTLTCSSGYDSGAQTPTDYGNGDAVPQGIVGYKHQFEITGLAPFTQYTYQGTQVGGGTVSGSFYTLPNEDDDFAIFFTSCDSGKFQPVSTLDPPDYDLNGAPGYMNYIKEYAETVDNLPVVGVYIMDDIGYVDGSTVITSAEGFSSTGVPGQTGLQFDYCLGYSAHMGLLDPTGINESPHWFGANTARQWVHENICIWPQWGDHEFFNDIGWDLPTNDATGSPSSAFRYANGKIAYDIFFGDLQPPDIQDQDTTSNHWGFTCGSMYVVGPDYISEATGNVTTPLGGIVSGPPSAMTALYGIPQVEDILNAMNNESAFKFLGMGHGIRYIHDPRFSTEYNNGAQHPIYDHCLSEHQRMFTETGHAGDAADPLPIMDNPWTNGVFGSTITAHGDWHRMKVEWHQKPAYTGNLAENFYSFCMGSNNGGAAPFALGFDDYLGSGRDQIWYAMQNDLKLPVVNGVDAGDINNTIVEAVGYPEGDYAPPSYNPNGLRIEVYGSRHPKEMHVVALGAPTSAEIGTATENTVLWRKKFVQGRGGNYGFDVAEDLSNPNTVNGSDVNGGAFGSGK